MNIELDEVVLQHVSDDALELAAAGPCGAAAWTILNDPRNGVWC
jgi:hypothetical protein